MEKNLLAILVGKRCESVMDIQGTLTEYGCIIKTRLGIHDGILNECSNIGLIILELVGNREKMETLQKTLQKFEGVKTQLITLSL